MREDDEGEARRVKSPREKTQFDVVYVEFDWYGGIDWLSIGLRLIFFCFLLIGFIDSIGVH